jgi:lysophospholipase L1-like esterase
MTPTTWRLLSGGLWFHKYPRRESGVSGPLSSFFHRGVSITRVVLAVAIFLGSAAVAIMPALAGSVSASATTSPAVPAWQTAWTSPTDFDAGVADNATARDIAQVAIGGTSIELTLSNLWSNTATTFGSVTVGIQQSGVAVVPGSIVPVTFGNSRSVTIAANASVTSDPVDMAVYAGESLSVSLAEIGPATVSVHFCCAGRIDSYATSNGVGDLTNSPTAAGFNPTLGSTNMRWLSAIAVSDSPGHGTVVAFGDSITEGFGYQNNGFGWPSALQARLAQLAPTQQVSVVNEGISGNTLTAFPPGTSYADTSGGLPGSARLVPDALSLPGVKDVILFLGTNDIWFGAGGESGHPIPPYGTAAAIESGMEEVIAATHAQGIKIFGVTLLPRASSDGFNNEEPEAWTPAEQATLSAVDAWMLTPGSGFDGVINLAAVMGDVYDGACQPTMPYPPYYTGDNLHPNIAGETVMADAISTTLFGIPQAPQVPQLVAVTPTPGCPGAVQAEEVLALARQPATTPTTPTTNTTPRAHSDRRTASHRSTRGHLTADLLIAPGALVVLSMAALVVTWRRGVHRRSWYRDRGPRTRTRPPIHPLHRTGEETRGDLSR